MKVTDPVCGKAVDLGAAEPVEHCDWAYFFCSDVCRARFLAAPDRYAQPRAQRAPPPHQTAKPHQPAR